MNAGLKTIEWLYSEQLKVDAEWSIRTTNGFTWWAHRHAQHVELVRDVRGPNGENGHLVRIRTEFVRGKDLKMGGQALDLLMSTPSLSGVVHEPAEALAYLSSAVWIHEGVWQWMARLLSVAAMQQVSDAHFLAASMAPAVGGTPAVSAHPKSGARDIPDELAASFPSMCDSAGIHASHWGVQEFDDALTDHMQGPQVVLASGGGPGVTIEFPYGEATSLCTMKATVPHPRFGNGLQIRQLFPLSSSGSNVDGYRDLALRLNRAELSEDPKGYGLGGFCYREGCVQFNAFLPNLIYMKGLLPNLFYQCAARAAHLQAQLLGSHSVGPTAALPTKRPQSGLERVLRFFRDE
jgi:hypothetical protein